METRWTIGIYEATSTPGHDYPIDPIEYRHSFPKLHEYGHGC